MNYPQVSFLLFSFLATSASAAEQRTEIQFSALPESVRSTVSHVIDKDKITKIEKISEDDHLKFQIKSNKTVHDKDFVNIDMTVAPDGEIMTLAKEVPMFKIPFHIMQQVNRLYPDLKVDEVELVQTRHFLLQGKTAGQPVSLEIYDDGSVNELQSAQKPPQQVVEPTQEKAATTPSADSYQKNWSDDDAGLWEERSEGKFDPNLDDE